MYLLWLSFLFLAIHLNDAVYLCSVGPALHFLLGLLAFFMYFLTSVLFFVFFLVFFIRLNSLSRRLILGFYLSVYPDFVDFLPTQKLDGDALK